MAMVPGQRPRTRDRTNRARHLVLHKHKVHLAEIPLGQVEVLREGVAVGAKGGLAAGHHPMGPQRILSRQPLDVIVRVFEAQTLRIALKVDPILEQRGGGSERRD